MRYFALATDYDGTLAHDGVVSAETIAALERFRATGRKLIMVTGRELADLLRVFPRVDLFDIIDPEGDYEGGEAAATLGDPNRDPSVDAVLELLGTSSQNVIVNLLGIALEHRPSFFEKLLPRIQELRARSGRPH